MKKYQILLAEDNEGDILLTRECLEESGRNIELSVVRDGKEAQDFVSGIGAYTHAPAPDLILLDINLPKKTGLEVLQFIKGHDHLRCIPVILLTTSASDKDVSRAYCNYANAFIMKPTDAEVYFATMKSLTEFWLNAVSLPKINLQRI